MLIGVCYMDKYHQDANFGTRLSVRLIRGVRLPLNWGPLNRGFTVLASRFFLLGPG